MRIHLGTFLFLFGCTLPACTAHAQQLLSGVLAIHAEEIAWQESPVGWEMAVLYGDISGNDYSVVRLRMRPNWDAPAHTHERTELEVVRVLSGTMHLAFGEAPKREDAVAYGPGSFIVYPAGTTSRMFTGDGEVIVEVTHLPIK
jgi:mannose-6-phosphate isomerase-like protein (cupin superfamily)